MRLSASPGSFKKNISNCFCPFRNYLFYVGDRSASIFHTRLRLNFSALNYDLFTKNCFVSPACKYCNASIEDAKHYFLYCPSFAALRNILLASAAHILGNKWLAASDKKKKNWLLSGVPDIEFQTNV